MSWLSNWRLWGRRRSAERHCDPAVALSLRAKRVLNGIGIALVLVAIRLWHLTVIAHDAKLEEARRPQQRLVIEPAKRGTIRDRYNLPLAINKVQYQAAIVYSQLQQIPTCTWQRDATGQRVKCYRRRDYISQLAQLLAHELDLDAVRVEDLIHSKAALYHQIPFVLKQDISEREYYRLKMLEREWLGITACCQPRRYYPQGRVGADIVGYLGPIDRVQYEAILQEIRTLKEFLQQWDAGEDPALPDRVTTLDEAQLRLEELQELAYSISDSVGKGGIEKRCEELLRGFRGQRTYCSDARGNFLRELPGGHPPQPGKRLLLSLSAELQAFAEELLIANEGIRQARVSNPGSLERSEVADKQPWIKGGAVVALDPLTGEVLALASYPRFDPNDFIAAGNASQQIERRQRVNRWLENDNHLADLWDQRQPLIREICTDEKSNLSEEIRWLGWEEYLGLVLPSKGPLRQAVEGINNLTAAVDVSKSAELLLNWSGEGDFYVLLNVLYPTALAHGSPPTAVAAVALKQALEIAPPDICHAKASLDRYVGALASNYDKALVIDLCRLAADDRYLSEELLVHCGSYSLDTHRRHCCAAATLREVTRSYCRKLFRQQDFATWRQQHSKAFLQAERSAEKAAGRYAQPYIDLLDRQERELFDHFWDEHKEELLNALLLADWGALPTDSPATGYCEELRRWHYTLQAGQEPRESWQDTFDELASALAALPPWLADEYLKALRSYSMLNRPLFGRYRPLRRNAEGQQQEKHLAAAFYPLYGFSYGRSYAYRQATTQGSIFKLVTAYAAMAQHCHRQEEKGLAAGDLNPLVMFDTVERHGNQLIVGYAADGTPIPQHYKGGRLPKSLKRRIGTLDIVKAFVTSSNPYFCLLAGDILASPEDLAAAARLFSYGSPTGINLPAEIGGKVPEDLSSNRTGLYATAIGQHTLVVTPLQAAVMLAAIANGGQVMRPKIVAMAAGTSVKSLQESVVQAFPSEVLRLAWLPAPLRAILLEGMRQVAIQTREGGLRTLKRLYKRFPTAIRDYIAVGDQLVGKTSTAESVEVLDLELTPFSRIYNHLWFGGILFQADTTPTLPTTYVTRDAYGTPELVVVVYLRYGAYGKDAAPIAAQVAQKWRAIKEAHEVYPKK